MTCVSVGDLWNLTSLLMTFSSYTSCSGSNHVMWSMHKQETRLKQVRSKMLFFHLNSLFRIDGNWVLMFHASGENRNIHRKVCLHLLVCVYYFLPHKTKWKRTLISCYGSSLVWRRASKHGLCCIRSLFKHATQILFIEWGNVYQIWKRADQTHHTL